MMLAIATTMQAIPAKRGNVTVTQPDGTTITIQLHGDEWNHFTTTADGYTVKQNARGYYMYAQKENGMLKATQMVAHDANQRSAKEQAYLAGVKKYLVPEMTEQLAKTKKLVEQQQKETLAKRRVAASNRAAHYNYNNFKGLVILVQFNDKEFSREDYATIANDMLNQENYTGFDNEYYTGSVRDYFSDNSGGKFKPEFDVVGPYTVNYSQYDCNMNNGKCIKVLNDAINQADNDVNFSDYDGDNNGQVDLVYFIIAGNGANYSGNNNNLWWPHRSIIYDYKSGWYLRKDGVLLSDYASSVELSGYTAYPLTVKIDGIGTICHEFSHVLGLPDFYDTDYESSGGESNHPGDWSLMAGGSYFNDGRTPVGYSLYERYSVGFTDEPEVINAVGDYTLNPLYSSETGYRLNTPNNKEFFLLENRQKGQFKWDAYLPTSGMLVHRVELNDQIWNDNKVNINPSHNYYEVVRANGYQRGASDSDVFPGSRNVTTLHHSTSPANLKTWDGKATKWGLFNIQQNNGVITFEVQDALLLDNITLPETAEVAVGGSLHLTPVVEPYCAEYTLTWESDDPAIATVDQNGYVKGLSVGSCIITAKSDNGKEASCQISVIDIPYYNISEFKQQSIGSEVLLNLENAEVTYVNGKQVYLRDQSGALILNDMNLGLKRNDIVNGMVFAKVGSENMMPLAFATNKTNTGGLIVTAGSTVVPREVKFEDLTEADYADFIVVKGVKLISDGGVYAVNGDKRARIWNKFNLKNIKVPSDYNGNYFDVQGIYGTDIVKNNVIDELYLTGALVKVDAPTGIEEIHSNSSRTTTTYNLSGQRVGNDYKGLVIKNGKKQIMK